jgi:hypothetical protein
MADVLICEAIVGALTTSKFDTLTPLVSSNINHQSVETGQSKEIERIEKKDRTCSSHNSDKETCSKVPFHRTRDIFEW